MDRANRVELSYFMLPLPASLAWWINIFQSLNVYSYRSSQRKGMLIVLFTSFSAKKPLVLPPHETFQDALLFCKFILLIPSVYIAHTFILHTLPLRDDMYSWLLIIQQLLHTWILEPMQHHNNLCEQLQMNSCSNRFRRKIDIDNVLFWTIDLWRMIHTCFVSAWWTQDVIT